MIFTGIILGFVQGLTEFLPVSSSGHLVIFQSMVPGFSQPGVLFDVMLHTGTSFAILICFFREILKLKLRDFVIIVIASVPAGLVGVFLGGAIESLFSNLKVVGFALLVTGFLDLLTDRAQDRDAEIDRKKGFLVGIAQAVATIPGISRSGSTIFASTYLGVERSKAAKFSFLLSIPAVLGATVLELVKHPEIGSIDYWFYISGFLAALVSGVISIKLVMNLLKSKRFKIFGFYCLIVGAIVLMAL